MRKSVSEAINECLNKHDMEGAKKVVTDAFKNNDFAGIKEMARFLADSFEKIEQNEKRKSKHDDCNCKTCQLIKKVKEEPCVVACNDGIAFIRFYAEGIIALEACGTVVAKVDMKLRDLQDTKSLDKVLEALMNG